MQSLSSAAMSIAPLPADLDLVVGLVEMERELTRLLIEYDELRTAWPKGGHVLVRAKIGRQVADALARIDDLEHAIATTPARIRPKPLPPRHHAFKGAVSRIVLSALRQSDKPLTTHDLAQHVMAERGLNTADKRLVKVVSKRAGACLRHHRARGVLRSAQGPGRYRLWEIMR